MSEEQIKFGPASEKQRQLLQDSTTDVILAGGGAGSGKTTCCLIKNLDSIYDPLQKPGTIIAQEPEPGACIKSGRTVYLHSIRYTPPLIVMPALLYKSERQALAIMQSYGFKTGWIKTSIADCNGCVIAQMIGLNTVNAGDSVLKGSTINLMIGIDSTAVFVQDSIGLDSINALSEPFTNDAF